MRLFTDRRLTFAALSAALVALYLSWWISYADIRQHDQYERLAPGAAAESADGTARLLTLQQTFEITDSGGGKPDVPDAGAVYVVATIEIVQRRPSERTWCDVQLVSVQRRVWPEDGPTVERALPDCNDEDIHPDQPYRYEAVFMIPVADADGVAGVGIRNPSAVVRTPVLTPPV